MTIKQQGGVFGRNPTFNDVTSNNVTTEDLYVYHPTTNQIAKFESGDATAQIVVSDNVADVRIKNTAGKMLLEADPNQEGAGSYLRFTVDGSTAAEFTASGNLAFPSGQGIDFSATAGTGTSELFDDYEEGTWTPTLTRLTAGDFSYSASGADEGTYTKIGRMVYAKFRINGTFTESTASGAYLITGLPFTSPTNNHLFSVFYTSGGTVLDAVPRALDTRIQLLFTPTSGFNYVGGGFYTAS